MGGRDPRKNRDFLVELGETTHPVQKNRPVKKSPGPGRPTPAVNSLKAYPEPNPRGRERAGWYTQELGRLPVLRRSCGRLLGSPAHESPPADPAIQQRRLVEQSRRGL